MMHPISTNPNNIVRAEEFLQDLQDECFDLAHEEKEADMEDIDMNNSTHNAPPPKPQVDKDMLKLTTMPARSYTRDSRRHHNRLGGAPPRVSTSSTSGSTTNFVTTLWNHRARNSYVDQSVNLMDTGFGSTNASNASRHAYAAARSGRLEDVYLHDGSEMGRISRMPRSYSERHMIVKPHEERRRRFACFMIFGVVLPTVLAILVVTSSNANAMFLRATNHNSNNSTSLEEPVDNNTTLVDTTIDIEEVPSEEVIELEEPSVDGEGEIEEDPSEEATEPEQPEIEGEGELDPDSEHSKEEEGTAAEEETPAVEEENTPDVEAVEEEDVKPSEQGDQPTEEDESSNQQDQPNQDETDQFTTLQQDAAAQNDKVEEIEEEITIARSGNVQEAEITTPEGDTEIFTPSGMTVKKHTSNAKEELAEVEMEAKQDEQQAKELDEEASELESEAKQAEEKAEEAEEEAEEEGTPDAKEEAEEEELDALKLENTARQADEEAEEADAKAEKEEEVLMEDLAEENQETEEQGDGQ
ncbi:expressed unknown protein [Seminavis robusta]|uniref:Uncharacterized protein n=1 Tax=Seminavis robusta TaxID=568900 RepID=A0A9N8EVJ9_9STRA|nr:expressed unknown protein [Seminavis robusta]|eukprot:Sro2109_g314950.1 n/a (527) ;mRNA; r:7626-9206